MRSMNCYQMEQRLYCIQQNMLNKQMNVVLALNCIEQGLNFIVPKDWWIQLLLINSHVRDTQNINFLHYHPLQVLLEIGIISIPYQQQFSNLKTLHTNAHKIATNLNDSITSLKLDDNLMGKKRNRPVFEWWDFEKINLCEGYSKGLICPLVMKQMLQALALNIEWKVVSPKLYKLLNQKHSMMKGEQHKNYLIGIPIFLTNMQIGVKINDSCKRDMDYMLKEQIPSSVYLYTCGFKYGFVGYLQNKLTYPQIAHYLFYGLLQMDNQDMNPSTRRVVSFLQDQVYSNIQDIQNIFPRWNPYQRLNKKDINDQISIIQFGCFTHQQDQQLFHNKQPIKKIKSNSPLSASYMPKMGSVNRSQPTIVSTVAPKFQERMARFNKIKKEKPHFFRELLNQNDGYIMLRQQQSADTQAIIQSYTKSKQQRRQNNLHEQQTRSQDIPSNTFNLQRMLLAIKIDQNRIEHPIWKAQYRHKSLIKQCQYKMGNQISLPFCHSKGKTIKTKDNSKVYLTKGCNKLVYNEQGQLVEQQLKKQTISEQQRQIEEDVIKQLQNLALQVTGKKTKIKVEYLCKEETIEFKNKFELENQPCKNDEIDDLEEAQSRQC